MSVAPNRSGTRGLLLDAMGTVVRLTPPAPRLARSLVAAGYANSDARVAAAVRDEIAYYRRHHVEGGTPAGLIRLRAACAAVLAHGLDAAPPLPELTQMLVDALEFTAYPDAVPALRALHWRGVRVAIVSDWDCTLEDHLERLGVGAWIDAVVVSAEIGVRKPDPRLFEAALARLGVVRDEAVVCGDDPSRDLAGAVAAGIRGVLIDREGRHPHLTPRVGSLGELARLI